MYVVASTAGAAGQIPIKASHELFHYPFRPVTFVLCVHFVSVCVYSETISIL